MTTSYNVEVYSRGPNVYTSLVVEASATVTSEGYKRTPVAASATAATPDEAVAKGISEYAERWVPQRITPVGLDPEGASLELVAALKTLRHGEEEAMVRAGFLPATAAIDPASSDVCCLRDLNGSRILVPVPLVRFGTMPFRLRALVQNSVGWAAHPVSDEAGRAALLELVERHAFAWHWTTRESGSYLSNYSEDHTFASGEYWQLQSPLDVHVIAALARLPEDPSTAAFGLGSGLDLSSAAEKAQMEATQILASLVGHEDRFSSPHLLQGRRDTIWGSAVTALRNPATHSFLGGQKQSWAHQESFDALSLGEMREQVPGDTFVLHVAHAFGREVVRAVAPSLIPWSSLDGARYMSSGLVTESVSGRGSPPLA